MKYRSRTDIVSQILEASLGGTTKTKIMYKAYLSYDQLREYLSVLIENGLLQYNSEENQYKVTQKGNQFLRTYQQMAGMTGEMRDIRV